MITLPKNLIQKCLKNVKFFNDLSINPNFCLNKRLLSLTSTQTLATNEEIIDVQKYRENNGIKCLGNSIADPIHSFDCYKWPEMLDKRIKHLGFKTPTPIQSQSLPIVFSGRDLVAIANSGSGKTLCFVLPALLKTLTARLDNWPKCLVLAPTRELTHQIERVVKQFRFVRSVCLYGGVSYETQEMLLKRANPHIVIATPSRMQLIVQKGIASLEHIDYVVIDEADHMLKLGLESNFRQLMHSLPQKRQTLMFSATWPQSIQNIAEEFLKDYIHITVTQTQTQSFGSLTVNKNIQQMVRVCKQSEKVEKLIECINEFVPTVSGFIKTIIFVRTKRMADQLVRVLNKESFPSRALHSNKEQKERDYVIREFRKGTIPILIATDVASRGLDFNNVKLVINFDFPSNIEDYIHRIGRTGRHKEKGNALTLFTSNNIYNKTSFIQLLEESKQKIDQKLIDLNSDSDKESVNKEDSGYESSGEYDSDSQSDNESPEWNSDTESKESNDETIETK